jgi:hypothetical protein
MQDPSRSCLAASFFTDRNLRFAARIALEHQPVASWKDKALSEANPRAALTALMALARSSGGDKALQKPILDALGKIDFKSLKGLDRVTLIRDYMLAFTRLGEPDAATKAELIAKLFRSSPRMTRPESRSLRSARVSRRCRHRRQSSSAGE